MRTTVFFLLLSLFALASCNDNAATETKQEPAASSSASGGGCVEGRWTMTENGTTRAFVFNADKSGKEEFTATDIRPFTWSLKDEKTVHIVYTAHGDVQSTAYDLSLNCDQKTISYYGAVYKK
jgi:ABC-type Fe3+-hydroxamate transport system substrate-binding protein